MLQTARLAVAAGILAFGLATGARAQPPPEIVVVPDVVVQKMLVLGLQNIQRATCDGFNQCTPATPAEFKNPPVTVPQARAALMIGGRSALARWCGLDADRRSVLPFSRQLKQSKQYNERQLALLAVIHGIQQSIVTEQLKTRGECDAATRSKLDAQLPKS